MIGPMRRGVLLIALACVAAVAVPSAFGADFGRGIFKGKADSEFDNDRPATPVEVKVKGSRVRLTKLVLEFECSIAGSGGQVQKLNRTVETNFTRVRKGPAGGGAAQNTTVKANDGPEQIDLTVNYGLRQRTVLGNVNATLDFEGLPCTDDVEFKANKR
jgi:hypothetical protein